MNNETTIVVYYYNCAHHNDMVIVPFVCSSKSSGNFMIYFNLILSCIAKKEQYELIVCFVQERQLHNTQSFL